MINSPEATSGTFDGAPNIQTPSSAEHGPEGVLFLSNHKNGERAEGSQ